MVHGDRGGGGVPPAVRSGQKSSVPAAGTVPTRRPRRTMPSTRRLGVFRTRHHERTKSMTEETIHTKNRGAKYRYVAATRARGPSPSRDEPLLFSAVRCPRDR